MSTKKTDGSFKIDPNGKRAKAAVETAPEEPEQKKPTKRKKSDGKRVNFVLPWDTYAQWEEVAEAFGGNFSQFAVKAIEKDLKNNAAIYKEVIERLG